MINKKKTFLLDGEDLLIEMIDKLKDLGVEEKDICVRRFRSSPPLIIINVDIRFVWNKRTFFCPGRPLNQDIYSIKGDKQYRWDKKLVDKIEKFAANYFCRIYSQTINFDCQNLLDAKRIYWFCGKLKTMSQFTKDEMHSGIKPSYKIKICMPDELTYDMSLAEEVKINKNSPSEVRAEVLRLSTAGKSKVQIAEKLGISIKRTGIIISHSKKAKKGGDK